MAKGPLQAVPEKPHHHSGVLCHHDSGDDLAISDRRKMADSLPEAIKKTLWKQGFEFNRSLIMNNLERKGYGGCIARKGQKNRCGNSGKFFKSKPMHGALMRKENVFSSMPPVKTTSS